MAIASRPCAVASSPSARRTCSPNRPSAGSSRTVPRDSGPGVGQRQRADPAAEDDVELAVVEQRDRLLGARRAQVDRAHVLPPSRSPRECRAPPGGFIASTARPPSRASSMSPLPPAAAARERQLGLGEQLEQHRHRARQADLDHPPGHRAHFGDRREVEPERGARERADRLAQAPCATLSAVSSRPSGQVPSRRRKMKLRPSSVTIQRSASAGTTSPWASSATRPAPVAARKCCAPAESRTPLGEQAARACR